MHDSGPFGEASGRPVPVAVETFHALAHRQTSGVSVRRDHPARQGQPAQLGRHRGTRRAVPGNPRRPAKPLREPPAPADRLRRGSAMSRRQQVVYLAAAWCLAYPDEELIGRVPLMRAALAELPRRPRRTSCAVLDRLESTPLDRDPGPLRARVRPRASATPCTCPTGPTGTPGAAARSWRDFKKTLPAKRLPGGHPRRTARLPADGPRVRRRGGPRRRPRAADADFRASLEMLRFGCSGTRHAVRRIAAGRLRHAARAIARRTEQAVDGDGRHGPPTEAVGLEPVRSAPAAREGPDGRLRLDVLLWGVLPYVMVVVLVGGTDLALPLRPVRLDDAVLPALRVAAAADRRPRCSTSASWS